MIFDCRPKKFKMVILSDFAIFSAILTRKHRFEFFVAGAKQNQINVVFKGFGEKK
jgi:hypothetical protein